MYRAEGQGSMIAKTKQLRAPFPWFGGKSRAAELIWSRIGVDCGNYVEPFFGSGAVWLNRPSEFSGWAVVNDIDGNLSNFWRAVRADPEAVADAACWPVNECDLHARHLWLVRNLPSLSARLMADPVLRRTSGGWGVGRVFLDRRRLVRGRRARHAEPDEEGVAVFTRGTRAASAGSSAPHQRARRNRVPHLPEAGVNRQLPRLTGGQGVNRQLPHGSRIEWLRDWFAELAESMRDVRVACGDWSRIMSVGTMTRNGTCAVLLDPPYSTTKAVYAHDSSTVAGDVREWCVANGGNPAL